ncbi:glycine-rich protein, partial [Sporichthya brevicatena]|uniref:glycine-rich protein n=2 Tax=Sporichthya TaxID=35750 RepID=UPI0031D18589
MRAAAIGGTLAVVLGGTGVPAAGASVAGECSSPTALGVVTCTYDDPSATDYLLRVPAGVRDVRITAHGAAGGAGGVLRSDVAPAPGGPGGMVAATFPVRAGDQLHVRVGGHGTNANGMKPGAAGRYGGAHGGAGAPAGGGGGGASSVLLNGTGHDARLLVAGGGGGGGGTLTTFAADAR